MAKKVIKKKKPLKADAKDNTSKGVKTTVTLKENDYGKKTEYINKGEHIEEQEEEILGENDNNLAVVKLSKVLTVNLGNYESAKIGCSITRKCKDTDEVIMQTFADVSTLLDEQIEFEVAELSQ